MAPQTKPSMDADRPLRYNNGTVRDMPFTVLRCLTPPHHDSSVRKYLPRFHALTEERVEQHTHTLFSSGAQPLAADSCLRH